MGPASYLMLIELRREVRDLKEKHQKLARAVKLMGEKAGIGQMTETGLWIPPGAIGDETK